MTYLVLYKVNTYVSRTSYEYAPDIPHYIDVPTWKEFENKQEAIECAIENKGVIVEAFKFNISKDKS